MFKTLWKNKILIIIIAAAIAFAGTMRDFITNYNKMTITLSLNYSGIEKGLNPDGTKYNIFELTSGTVLNDAINRMGVPDMTVEDLRSRLHIFAKGMQNVASSVKTAVIKGEEYTYAPNEYTISYSQKNKLAKNQTREVLTALSDAYTDYFFQNYVDKNYILQVDSSLYMDEEYLLAASVLETQISGMIDYLEDISSDNKAFVSEETGVSFRDLIDSLTNLRDVDVEKYRAYVIKSVLAKNRASLVAQLDYLITSDEFDHAKLVTEHQASKEGIDVYDQEVTKVVFIPSVDDNDDFYMNRTRTGIDYLTTRAQENGVKAEKLLKTINYNRYVLNIYRSAQVDEATNSAAAKTADTLLSDIDARLKTLSETATATDNEYRTYRSKDYIKYSFPKGSLTSYVSLSGFIRYGLYGLVIAIIIVVLRKKIHENLLSK